MEVDVLLRPSSELMNRINAGELDVILVTAGHARARTPDRGEVLYSERLEWVGRGGGKAYRFSGLSPPNVASPRVLETRTMSNSQL